MSEKFERISVIVPQNPFTPQDLQHVHHCLCALDVVKLMEWWPGLPHVPKKDPLKIKAIQRSLDWKRVAQIAAYLLQQEIKDADKILEEVFTPIYDPLQNEPGREWPPNIRGMVKYNRSSFPFFSNVLVHVNGAKIEPKASIEEMGELILDPEAPDFYLTVIDGQHRINGAYLALKILEREGEKADWLIPAEVFIDLDPRDKPPIRQAQIFIDVNLNQKKVDRSLVADLFPLARGHREPLDIKDRAQDIGRRLMLETGPLVGMIQIPGIRYGVKDVVTLATLNSGIEAVIPSLDACDITNLEAQTSFLAQILDCWLLSTGRAEDKSIAKISQENVVYQGRILVSVIGLTPAILYHLKSKEIAFISNSAKTEITNWFKNIIRITGLYDRGIFVSKDEFKKLGFLGSGGIGRFRNLLWAAVFRKAKLRKDYKDKRIAELADNSRKKVYIALGIKK